MVYDLGIIKRQKAMASPIAAAGGVITNIGSSTIHTFTSSGVFQPLTRNGTSPQLTVSYLVVAGGGGGGVGVDRTNGGGGAGGLISSSSFLLSTGTAYTVTVGAGGVPGSNGTYSRIANPTEITYSGYFTGGNYLSIPDNAVFDLSSNNFTFESWVYPTSLAAQGIILAKTNDASQYGQYELRLNTNGTLVLYVSTGGTTWNLTLTTATALSINTWYHIALTRNTGGVFTIWINGTSAATVTNNLTIWTSTWPVTIGNYRSGTSTPFTGYLSNYRIVKGTALYTTAFTPPLSVLTSATTGTSLLTLQNATFVDNSINNFTITATGSPTTTSTIVPPFGQFAYGGGAGGGLTSGAAAIGGSGGGAKHGLTGAVGISGQGQAGGTGYDGGGGGPWTAGGGGGKGGVGGNGSASKPGDGGVAGSSSISGTLTYYAGGGGGGFMNSSGGTGLGGGTSTTAQKGGGGDGNTSNVTGAGSSGTANTGGGGGGSGSGTPGYASGTGGSGVVIISYPNPAYTAPLTKQSDPYFKSNSLLLSSNPPTTTTIPVEYLIVGGGGGGSYGHDDFYGGSGGGAGGAFLGTANVSPGYTIALTVGAGGAGGTISSTSTNGINTTITTAPSKTSIAYGGGYGAYPTGITVNSPGGDGGSGGGGYFSNGGGDPSANGHGIQPASSTGGYGNDSGTGNTGNGLGASGGGAGTAGYAYNAAVNAGQGGSGKLFSSFSVYGTDASNSTAPSSGKGYFAGGGGAGNWYIQGNRAGGVGGGGAGSGTSPGSPGLANTGGGGGGGGGGGFNGGAGGSGIVIIRYSAGYPPAAETSGSPTIITTSGYTYYVFTSGGSIQLGSTSTTNNTSFVDSSANALTITATGTPTQGAFSPFGNNWSNYFNGSSYLQTPAYNATFSGDFTFECWAYISAYGSTSAFFTIGNEASGRYYFALTSSGGQPWSNVYGGGDYTWGTSSSVPLNAWAHVAWVRVGTTVTCYVNGVSVGTQTISGTVGNSGGITIGASPAGSYLWTGYLSNVRFVNGTALYTSNFTPATAPLPVVTNTVMLTCASNRFMDKSSTATTFTATGTPSVQRFSPFNNLGAYNTTLIGGSAYFNGSSYVQCQSTTAGDFNTSDFTVEFWMNASAAGTQVAVVATQSIAGNTTAGMWRISNRMSSVNGIYFNYTTGSAFTDITFSTTNYNDGAWHHIAACRASGTLRMFVDGKLVGTPTTVSQSLTSGQKTNIGYNAQDTQYYTGYVSNLRIVKGTAVYTTAFTPPAAPVGTIDATTSTSLLLKCETAGIYDATTNNDIVTVGTAALSTTVTKFNSRSMYFNGSTDYLLMPSSSAYNLGSGDFTIECWIYPTTVVSNGIFGIGTQDPDSNLIRIGSGSTLQFWLGGSNSGGSGAGTKTGIITCATTLVVNTWYHIALVRSGSETNNVKLYLNGVLDGQGTATYFIASNYAVLGRDYPTYSAEYFAGYIDDLRVTKGVARYTAAFTPTTQTLPLR